ncbi:MAG: TIM barrel protein [Chloroflexota bacterium]|jgi:sugar phosphate isomerase/epimerase|nr:TIM barrel protein [Chloroflexota bacterium]MDP6756711.1 TIM barrel protein [Chloroflexota bacterium]
MEDSWRGMFDLGMIHPMIYPDVAGGDGPIVETVTRFAEDDFFNLLEVTRINDAAVRAEVRNISEVSGLRLGFSAQPGLLGGGLNLADLDEAGRKAAVANICESLDQAYELGCVAFALFDGKDSNVGAAKKQQAVTALETSLLEIFEYAEDNGDGDAIPISLEQFDSEIDKKSLIGPTEDAVRLGTRMRQFYPSFGIMVDHSHLPLLHVQPRSVLNAVGGLMFHAHLGSAVIKEGAPNYGDNHPNYHFEYSVNHVHELKEFLGALDESGFFDRPTPTPRPIISFEMKPFEDQSSELVIAGTKRVFREAWALA